MRPVRAVAVGCLVAALPTLPCLAAPVALEGVPPMDYSAKRYSYHISALYSVLQYLGCPMSYDELMVASGAAFRMGALPGRYDFGTPQVSAPEDLVLNAAEAAGAKAERRQFASQDEAWEALRESIDNGRPVIAWRGEAAQIICGYDPRGRTMCAHQYAVSSDTYGIVPFEMPGPRSPLTGPSEAVFVDYDPNVPPPDLDWPAIVERAVAFADWPATERVHGTFVFGLSAYDTWADTLRAGPDHLGPNKDSQVTEAMARAYADARACAGAVLQEQSTIHESFAEAAAYYMAEAEALQQLRNLLQQGTATNATWPQKVDAMATNFADPGIREQMAQFVETAKEADSAAIDALRTALQDWAPTGQPPSVETAGPDAEELCEKGRRLKAQRRYAAAAEALRAAIKADETHVEAHWVLGWVLIELKDTEGAARAFRKVIELAPGTDRAQEAQKALERLGA
jgi:tetratricopeptide (TPR) repeat protein